MSTAVRIEHVSKHYRIGARRANFTTLRDAFTAQLRAPLDRLKRGGRARPGEVISALRDVSFDIGAGEVVGIIGRNGAGKSTLLKILSRITEPTAGRIELYGRIGSLLEVGTGFHPELTGRENVFLNGAILGMKRAEIARKFETIVSFAEIDKFIDTPVKFYSSGMYVRLAFSVAAHLEPEILVIDEVLSVGDMAFQQKCIDKIGSLRKQTKAIIIVSHNMISVKSICSRVVLLSGGVIAANGAPNKAISIYERLMMENMATDGARDEKEQGMGQIEISSVELRDQNGELRQIFETGEKLRVVIEYKAVERVDGAVIYAGIRRPDGFICTGSSTKLEGLSLPSLLGPGVAEVEIPELLVVPGHYVLDVVFYDRNFEYRTYYLGRKQVHFEVHSTRPALDEKYGVAYQRQHWTVKSADI